MPNPTIQDIQIARQAFEDNEPRDLFYRAATELVELALQGKTSLSVAEALAVLLQTWNMAFYRYRRFDSQHFTEIERLVSDPDQTITAFRQRSIESFRDGDKVTIKEMFQRFERVLGPVGAAKCLHLLSPRFFPLWDRAIAKEYGLTLKQSGENGENYCRFVEVAREQSLGLGGERAIGRNPLKAIDEYNYCKYTKHWI